MIIPVVLAGGVGSRLWPLSRELYPKQCIKLAHEEWTMLQATCARLDGIGDIREPIIVCNEEHRFLIAQQLQEIGTKADIILEPEGKNTAPAIALAAIQAQTIAKDATLLVLPADHVITNKKCFHDAVNRAKEYAQASKMVTFGVKPVSPETGYGYIKAADKSEISAISAFVEKPDRATAETYLEQGGYYWNSGMFMFRADSYLTELSVHNAEISGSAKAAMVNSNRDMDFIRPSSECFANCPSDSIDYAVMEHTKNGVVVAYDGDWSDVGSWSALYELHAKDENGNVFDADVLSHNAARNYVKSEHGVVALVGVEGLVIVQTPDALLVAEKDQAQDVKHIVNLLKKQNKRIEHEQHTQVHRPWGTYETVDIGENYQVKRIVVNPHSSLSLQMHHHRAEHWVVVKGTALVHIGEIEKILVENESVYIPIKGKHRLSNPGEHPLHLIEVQSGGYLGEDDIVRFEDDYGRK